MPRQDTECEQQRPGSVICPHAILDPDKFPSHSTWVTFVTRAEN